MVKKLNRLKVEEKLKSIGLLVFTPHEFSGVFGVSKKTASAFIGRNTKSGLFIKLRNKYYMLKDSNPSIYFIANKIYQPSYISLETALSYYGLIPEVVYTITSISTKPTREFVTPRGAFSYQRIKKNAFTGYSIIRPGGGGDSKVLFADSEKALADYLYFVDLKKKPLNDRLTLRGINKDKLLEYATLFERASILKIIDELYAEQNKPRKTY